MSDSAMPSRDSEARDYINFFASNIAADPGRFLLTSVDAASISLAALNFNDAYLAAVNPATRNEQTIIQKDESRNAAEGLVRLYSMQIKYNAGVSTEDKNLLGIQQPNNTRTERNVAETLPLLSIIGALQGSQTLRFSDSTTPDSRKKPFGAEMLDLRVNVAESEGGTPEEARPCGIYSKNPIGVAFNSADNKMVATYWGRWANTKGQFGPWSLPVSMTIAA